MTDRRKSPPGTYHPAMPPKVAWIYVAPVKGLRLEQRDDVRVTAAGIPGDRAFFIVDERTGAMVSATRLGPLVAVIPAHDPEAGTLGLRFPDGAEVTATVELGETESVGFAGAPVPARPVRGAFSDALSEHCGIPLRLFAVPPGGSALDRGREGAVTLLSLASLARLASEAGAGEPVDRRRFRMTFGVEGLQAHGEDEWLGGDLRVGKALVRVTGNVGRCALTTRNADTGVVDFKTLHHLAAYRRAVETTEPLPFGVYAQVIDPGRVRRGDAVLAG
jgi:uncharacterized protein